MNNTVQQELLKNKLIACQYVDGRNNLAKQKFPYNPNGSILDIAALTNAKGNVLAMMPHPERAYYFIHQPDWQNKKNKSKYGDGYNIFKAMESRWKNRVNCQVCVRPWYLIAEDLDTSRCCVYI